jgi:DNA-binding transcriptional LysR family regulator
VSNSLSRLREYFDDDLLSHVGRKLEITALGESLRDPVTDILNRIDSTVLMQPEFEPHKTERIFSIFASDYTQLVLGPHLLTLAQEQSSSARIQFLQQDNPHKQLERGEADLLIIPERFISMENPYDVLFEEEYVCLVWRDSQLAKSKMTQERYIDAGHTLLRLQHAHKDYFDYMLSNKFGVERREVVSTFSMTTLGALVMGTENIATVHARLARLMVHAWPLEMLPLPFEIPPMKQCFQWHHYRAKDPGLVWLRDLLIKAAKRMDDQSD